MWLQGHSTQYSLLFMLESLNKALDKGLFEGDLLTDLSRLHVYGFSKEDVHRYQRTKVGDKFSHGLNSLLGALLFNIYINDLFLFSQYFYVAKYGDDCSPYDFSGSIDEGILKLQNDSSSLFKA